MPQGTTLTDNELDRRLLLLMEGLYGGEVLDRQRQAASSHTEVGPCQHLRHADQSLTGEAEDLLEATQALAERSVESLTEEAPQLGFKTTDEGKAVALVNTERNEVVARATDVTVSEFADAGFSETDAFYQSVLVELKKQFGDSFVTAAIVMDCNRRDGFVLQEVERLGIEPELDMEIVQDAVAELGQKIYDNLDAGTVQR